ncbi:hypothetical protein AYI70_g1716 [Smittium culicis]|uniref:Uncharacterized protein n=1 Tax=Smittium culicis TaxID=133412 RepID=A0A1R1YBF8_9FUNG|nr:hypothetical protein AYI70_g1716 [Smittium culicis]
MIQALLDLVGAEFDLEQVQVFLLIFEPILYRYAGLSSHGDARLDRRLSQIVHGCCIDQLDDCAEHSCNEWESENLVPEHIESRSVPKELELDPPVRHGNPAVVEVVVPLAFKRIFQRAYN